ncbi:MAG TPA: hypothetical protein DCE18_20280 [Syntrophobacteraceae bacterium]|jgi:hypothetical protein|nr:hypothetical protein [Syntrophobacteraceae bacterium]HBZ54354.1 hypothetical protein [Syntrophobacteraceae bacterium]
MKKPVMFCMRMSSTMRDVLKIAAEKDHRSVTSLLHKIIADYLAEAGLPLTANTAADRRRFPRKRVVLPARTYLTTEKATETASGLVLDLSMGGVLLAYPKGSKLNITSIRGVPGFELSFQLPESRDKLSFNCSTRHMYDLENEIQVGAAFDDADENQLQTLRSYLM